LQLFIEGSLLPLVLGVIHEGFDELGIEESFDEIEQFDSEGELLEIEVRLDLEFVEQLPLQPVLVGGELVFEVLLNFAEKILVNLIISNLRLSPLALAHFDVLRKALSQLQNILVRSKGLAPGSEHFDPLLVG